VRSESGQAAVEWVGLVLLAALALGALASLGPSVDGRSFGGFLAHRIVCAVKGGCRDGDAALARAYGERDAELVRRHAPSVVYEPGERQLPVDYRRCRAVPCAEGPDDRDLDVHSTDSGRRATAFTRVIRRNGRTYIQYWLYYPDSNSTWAGSSWLWNHSPLRWAGTYPGWHRDDWEGYQVRIDRGGAVSVRASSHGHYQGCKQASCRDEWFERTGWTRVSRGSHAGHIPADVYYSPWRHPRDPRPRPTRRHVRPLYPGRDLHERTTTAEGLRLIPLESLPKRRYRRRDDGIEPPWQKDVYRHPESDSS
jgi:hypothetical protein